MIISFLSSSKMMASKEIAAIDIEVLRKVNLPLEKFVFTYRVEKFSNGQCLNFSQSISHVLLSKNC